MINNIVIIPVYKPLIDKWEEMSFRQCCKILGSHPICLVTFADLDCKLYYDIAEEYKIELLRENFESQYFNGIDGYNKLMLSKDFYKRFKNYRYMLIYQLDAYVFRDELDYWCDRGYDYIGAPWFENFGSHEEGNSLWRVGNGGFSLRRIKAMISILNYRFPVYKYREVRKNYSFKKTTNIFKTIKCLVLQCFGRNNNIKHLLLNNDIYEDAFICVFLIKGSRLHFNIAPVDLAMKFSFERSPQYLYEKNCCTLPFGCHAYTRYDYSFWKNHIV